MPPPPCPACGWDPDPADTLPNDPSLGPLAGTVSLVHDCGELQRLQGALDPDRPDVTP